MSSMSFMEKLLRGVDVKWKPLKEVTLPTSNIKWRKESRSYRYIDLTSVGIESKKIIETAEIIPTNAPSRAQKIVKENDVIFATTRPTQQRYCLIDKDYSGEVASTGYCVLRAKKDQVLPKWILHWVASADFKAYVEEHQSGSAYPAISDGKVKDFKIPIPCPENPKKSLEIQAEIVRILDAFTAMTAELTAELGMRQKQYNYYRDSLMLSGEGTEKVLLGDIATIGTGSHDTKDAVADGEYIFYARGREPLRLNSFDFNENAIITAGDGVGVGKVFHFARGKYALHQRAYRIVPHGDVDARFVYHYLIADFGRYLERTSVHASVTSLRRPMFLKYPLLLPPLVEQRRIVAILDKFDVLTQSITEGLPREIELRQKQYEYYRDLLLSFPKPDEAAA